jgi:hypothetical protein
MVAIVLFFIYINQSGLHHGYQYKILAVTTHVSPTEKNTWRLVHKAYAGEELTRRFLLFLSISFPFDRSFS